MQGIQGILPLHYLEMELGHTVHPTRASRQTQYCTFGDELPLIHLNGQEMSIQGIISPRVPKQNELPVTGKPVHKYHLCVRNGQDFRAFRRANIDAPVDGPGLQLGILDPAESNKDFSINGPGQLSFVTYEIEGRELNEELALLNLFNVLADSPFRFRHFLFCSPNS